MADIDAGKNKYIALPKVIVWLCMIQPLLDVLSYWTQGISHGSTVTTAIRAVIFAGVMLYAIWLSDRKGTYIAAAAVCILLYAGHLYAYCRCDLTRLREDCLTIFQTISA